MKKEMEELQRRLDVLLKKQELFQQEINSLKDQFTLLKSKNSEISGDFSQEEKNRNQQHTPTELSSSVSESSTFSNRIKPKSTYPTKTKREFEKFIGENLVNKIGILLLIIGVAIGVKYAIDKEWITPLMRVFLGYIIATALIFFAIRLKAKYLNYSAVLFSGAMAIFYFITYAAHAFYGIYPYLVSIILLVTVTGFTVFLAVYLNKEVIAHIGLVGAYIIPYLLKDPFNDSTILFTYISIINAGILIISLKKKWKYLFWLAFVATWTILLSWVSSGSYNNQTDICITYISIWFLTFYSVLLLYKIKFRERLTIPDIVIQILNSAILFGVGYIALKSSDSGSGHGLFTLLISLVHGGACYLIHKFYLKAKNLFNITSALSILFLIIAIAILSDDNRITVILWSIAAFVLFVAGRKYKIHIYEFIAYAVIFVTFVGIVRIWATGYYNFSDSIINRLHDPFINLGFLASVIVATSFGLIYYFSTKLEKIINVENPLFVAFKFLIPAFFLAVVFFGFFTEFALIGNNIFIKSAYSLNSEGMYISENVGLYRNTLNLKNLWLMNYSLFFLTILSFVNYKFLKNKALNLNLFLLSLLLVFIFFAAGLSNISVLREYCQNTNLSTETSISPFRIPERFISYAFFALFLFSVFRYVIADVIDNQLKRFFEIVLCISIFIVCSFELNFDLKLSGMKNQYGYLMSILWGVLSMSTVVYGIWKKKKHIRITGIILFGITLYRLFFYDLANLETMAKTIVFIIVGILLLVVSFLYNKFTKSIFDESKNQSQG